MIQLRRFLYSKNRIFQPWANKLSLLRLKSFVKSIGVSLIRDSYVIYNWQKKKWSVLNGFKNHTEIPLMK